MFQIAGGAIGLGLNTTIFTSRSESNLDAHVSALGARITDRQADLAHGILAGTESSRRVIAAFPSEVGQRLEGLVRDAFVAGLHAAFRVDAALAFSALIVAALFVGGSLHPHVRHTHQPRRAHHRALG
jgi:hypothetical protein